MSSNYAKRQPAKRLFASELEESEYQFKEKDEERAPNYLLLPSGDKANRVMMGGTLMSVEDVSSDDNDNPFWNARINDGTGEFRAFAGQYNPKAASVLQSIAADESMPPAYVIVIGKTKEYRPEDDESEILMNIQAETVAVVDEQQRNNWLKETVEHTLNRLEEDKGEYVLQADERHGDRAALFKSDLREVLERLE